MLYLRSKNTPEFPLTPSVKPQAERKLQAVSLARSASDLHSHPLARTSAVTIEMEYDEDAESFVTFVKELRRMSSFGETEYAALENTAEMIRGYIESMEANRKKIPLTSAKLAELKAAVRRA
jgi:predicted RNase H-like HicB family nuclease